MEIIKTGDERFRVTLSAEEARVFVKCINETVTALAAWEFPSRIGAEVEHLKRACGAIEVALK